MTEHGKWPIDALSVLTVVASIADVLPAIASLLTVLWSVIRIYETRTVQRWLGRAPAE